MPNAAARRPVIWRAFVRETGDASEATSRAATSATQGTVSGVRHSGTTRVRRTTTAHAAKAASTAVSRLVIDWRGRRTSGSVSSNGAASVSSATPAKSVRLSITDCGLRIADWRFQDPCHGAPFWTTQGTPAAYASNASRQRRRRSGVAYGGRKIVSKPETTERAADRLQDLCGSCGEGLAARGHGPRGAPADGGSVRDLLARIDAWLDGRRRDRFRDSAARRAGRRASAGDGGERPAVVAARAVGDGRGRARRRGEIGRA